MDLEAFLEISATLTGFADLAPSLGEQHLSRIGTTPEGAHLSALLEAYVAIRGLPQSERDRAIQERIMNETPLKAAVKAIILCWYTGDPVPDPRPPRGRTPEAYFGGLIWKVARAHPPGLSGGYFGHWTYGPDAG